MGTTNIEWTDHVWNPIVGCSIVSPGCTNCYAMKMAARLEKMMPSTRPGGQLPNHYTALTKSVNGNAVWTGRVTLAPDHIITQPLRWKRPRRIFVNSMGDLFHEAVPDEWIDKVFAVMALTPQHIFQVLTKRSKRMREYCSDPQTPFRVSRAIDAQITWPLSNCWLGVSAEDQQRADERIPDLLATRAAIRFVSAEPLLGPIDFTTVGTLATVARAFPDEAAREAKGRPLQGNGSLCGMQIDAIGSHYSQILFFQTPDHMGGFKVSSPRSRPTVDWIIVGGESGTGARPMHPDWARSIRDECAAAGTPFFFKQWGEWHPCQVTDGAWYPMPGHLPFDSWKAPVFDDDSHDGWNWRRIGKRRAGRTLDGSTHDFFPEMNHEQIPR